jgi:CPA1 family monovalent cation:H+ antiporter
MGDVELILISLFVAVAVLNAAANRLSLPYPIVLVVGGLALAVVPGIPDVELDPDLVLILFLPPLLYAAAFFSDLRSLRANVRPLSLTAIGLVLLTTAVVAVLAHEVIGMSWGVAFALGAIVSPTDPVAATSIMQRVGAPRRIVNLVEGESLFNDAAALVAYRVAVAAAIGGTFSLLDASLEFVGAVVGGIALGLAVAWVIGEIRRRLEDPQTEITISLFTGYAAYIPAEELHLSGVLAAVTAGIYLGWRAPELISPQTRLQAVGTWEVLTFLLNAILFVLIGLQLPVVLDGLSGRPPLEPVAYAAMVAAAVILTRFVWLFTVPYLIRVVDRRPSQLERRVGWRPRVIVGWSGMRGAVSLAAALAIPLETDAGAAFPDRDLILFITFAVILVTVVGQGLSLPSLIRRLGVTDEGDEEEQEELRARLEASKAAIQRLDELELEDWTRNETVERMRGLFEFRKRRFATRAGTVEDDGIEDRSLNYQRLTQMVLQAQREALIRLVRQGEISADVMRRIERELDLEESRLEI